MTCLRAARAQGVVPSLEEGLLGGLVPLSLLRQALVHKHEQVRLREWNGTICFCNIYLTPMCLLVFMS